MIRSGLVSITFRKLSPREIVELVSQAGLDGIEWGGDVHVLPGDIEHAREVGKITQDAGLTVASYGSYYRIGEEQETPIEFVLESAVALGAPTVRVWAGTMGSENADEQYRDRIVRESRRVADWAADLGITVAYEFHSGTLTDTHTSASALLEAVGNENLKTYWQPRSGKSAAYCLDALDSVLPWLLNVHVFHRDPDSSERSPLAAGEDPWKQYLKKIRSTGREHYAMLEFVRDDSPDAFLQDAETLKAWLRGL